MLDHITFVNCLSNSKLAKEKNTEKYLIREYGPENGPALPPVAQHPHAANLEVLQASSDSRPRNKPQTGMSKSPSTPSLPAASTWSAIMKKPPRNPRRPRLVTQH